MTPSWAIRELDNNLSQYNFIRHPDLYIPSEAIPMNEYPLSEHDSHQWDIFFHRYPGKWHIFFDPRAGKPMTLIGHIPLIPGTGKDNHITFHMLSKRMGYNIRKITSDVVLQLSRGLIKELSSYLGIAPSELGPGRAVQVSSYVWHINIPRVVDDIPVVQSSITMVLNHGNVVLIGLRNWGDVTHRIPPRLHKDEALRRILNHLQIPRERLHLLKEPLLSYVPMKQGRENETGRYIGVKGSGYSYRLVWSFRFRVDGMEPLWEAYVDAHTGEIISLVDARLFVTKKVVGGIFPVSNDGQLPDGVEIPGMPMPFADITFSGNTLYTNSAGLYTYVGGSGFTTLNGLYVRIQDSCGSVSEWTTDGDLDLGTSGGTDCDVPAGKSSGDTHAARSGFYELNRIKESAAAWLPSNSWLQGKLTANMNLNQTCNAYWNGSTVNFFKSGGGCRNTGEIAAVFDHEWGHGMDDFDSNGMISNPGEGYADIAAVYRLRTSCVGRGFFWTRDTGCGQDPAGTGYNCTGNGDCCLDCTGVRDVDWDKHASHTPHTPQTFILNNCPTAFCVGPCGRECHCEGYIPGESAWDLATRKLTSSPYNLDLETSFLVSERLFYLGSGNIGNWYNCSGGGANADGCNGDGGYLNWLAIDDDNGDLTDGTPHMMAIYSAFQDHGIACPSPTPQDSGCSTGPINAPVLTATAGHHQVTLTWNAVAGASKYWIFRGEGVTGCSGGKVKIAELTSTSYIDTDVQNGIDYHYVVMAVGSNEACLSPASACITVTPTPGPQASFSQELIQDSCPYGGAGNGNGVIEPGETVTLYVTTENTGVVDLTNISGQISTSTPGLTITDALANWPNLTVGTQAISTDPFVFTVADSVACWTDAEFTLDYSYDQGTNRDLFTLGIGTIQSILLIDEGFDAGIPTGWTVVNGGDCTETWGIVDDPATYACSGRPTMTGPYIHVDSNCAGSGCGVMDEELRLPSLDFSNCTEVTLSFDENLNIYVFGNLEHADVDVSIDGGTSWIQIYQRDGHDSDTSGQVQLDLSNFAGQQDVMIRFHYWNALADGWWSIDNVRVECRYPVCEPCRPPAPSIQATPVPVDFGQAETGEISNQDVTIQNTGTADLNITSLDPVTAPFSIVSDGCTGQTLSPQGTCLITVSFQPTTEGTYTSDLIIHSNDPLQPAYTIPLLGESRTLILTPTTAQFKEITGNGNGVIEAGEQIELEPVWRNDSNHPSSSTLGTLTSSSPLTILDGTAQYGSIASGATGSCTSTGDCYLFVVNTPRASGHLDAMLDEVVTGSPYTPTPLGNFTRTWILHVGGSFTDVPDSHGAYVFIETLFHHGITAGCSSNKYCPTEAVTRGQMAVYIGKVLESLGALTVQPCDPTTNPSPFTDIPETHPACAYIAALYSVGIVQGYPDGTYRPTNSVTRGQMAVYVAQSMVFAGIIPSLDSCLTEPFSDIPVSHPACSHILTLKNQGVIQGCGSGLYCPTSQVSRGQMAVFLTKGFALDLYGTN